MIFHCMGLKANFQFKIRQTRVYCISDFGSDLESIESGGGTTVTPDETHLVWYVVAI